MAFATTADVEALLGRPLTDAETDQAALALDLVAGLITDAAGKPSDWEPDPAIPLLRALSIEKTVDTIVNPQNLAMDLEQLGAYQRQQTYPRSSDVGLFLTGDEERQVRRMVYGPPVGTIKVRHVHHHEYLWPCEGS